MIVALILAAEASAAIDCSTLSGPVAVIECELAQSLSSVPEADCEQRITQLDMNVCSYRDYLRADIQLNRQWQRIQRRWRGTGEGEDFWDGLLDAQRAWIAFRDAECAVWGNMYSGGTIAPLMNNVCLTKVTKSRVKDLETLLDEPS